MSSEKDRENWGGAYVGKAVTYVENPRNHEIKENISIDKIWIL